MPANQFPDFCSNPNQTARDPQSFRSIVAVILCRMYQATTGGSSSFNSNNFIRGSTDLITDTSPHTILTVPLGEEYIITSISGSNGDDDTSTWTAIDFGSYTKNFYSSSGGGGFAVSMPTGIPVPAGTVITATNLTTGAAVYVSVEGYTQSA